MVVLLAMAFYLSIIFSLIFLLLYGRVDIVSFVLSFGVSAFLTLLITWFSYNNPDGVVSLITSSRKADSKKLLDIVENMKVLYGIHNVEVYQVPWDIINAFVVSTKDKHYLFVTDGAVESLTYRELEGVIAHEFAHMENRDSYYMTVAFVVAGLAATIAEMLYYYSFASDDRKSWLIFLLAIILIVVTPFITSYLISALSQQREYLADARAAEITKYPPGIINALIKVGFYNAGRYNVPSTIGALFFDFNDIRTHPPLYKRVERLSEVTGTPVDRRIIEQLKELLL